MRSPLEWLRSHPGWLVTAAILASFAACLALADWMAESRWQRYAAAARARGVKLRLEEFAPPAIPDAENFASLPMLQAAFSKGAKPFDLPRGNGARPGIGDPLKRQPIDWIAWRDYLIAQGFFFDRTEEPVRDVLAGLDHFAPQIAEWREGKTRPRCRFPLDLKAGAAMPLPHLITFQDAAFFFSLRTRAHLALGEPALAAEDLRDGLHAYVALSEEPTLISALIQMAALALTLTSVGEGLASHAWSDAELRQLNAELAKVRIWDDYRRAFESERGFGNQFFDELVAAPIWRRGTMAAGLTSGLGGTGGQPSAMALIPRGLYRNNQLRLNQYQDAILARAGPRAAAFDSDELIATGPAYLEGLDRYYYFLFRMSAPMFSNIVVRFVTLETKLQQTRTAIALERFHLARGHFPQTLAELVPEYLAEVPRDLHADAPMRYVPRGGDTFLLYAIGRDHKDGGGALDLRKTEREQTDLIWLYAPATN